MFYSIQSVQSVGFFFTSCFRKFNALKAKNPALKTLISIGGEHENSEVFEYITLNTGSMKKFALSTLKFLRDRNFDGLDIAWSPPNYHARPRFLRLIKVRNCEKRGYFDYFGDFNDCLVHF